MNEERISKIQQAQTSRELERATEGYREQVMMAHPAFRTYYGINSDLLNRQYRRALVGVKAAAYGRGDRYQDVIRVLEAAAEKELSLNL